MSWLQKYLNLKGEPLIPKGVTKYFHDQKPYTQANKQFVDETFPPTNDSLFSTKCCWDQGHRAEVENQGSYHWIRPQEYIGDNYCVYDEQVSQNDLKQGSLGDCYFLAALSAMTEFPGLIDQLFRGGAKKSNNGYYEIFMFIDEEWQIVIIDDCIPALQGCSSPAFVRLNRNVIWPLLLEKVWAKINDGFSNTIAGKSIWPFHLLTGFPCSMQYIDQNSDLNSLWNKLKFHDSRNDIMTCSAFRNDCGIYGSHQYTLRFAADVKDEQGICHKLMCIRNPWGCSEWQGDWSDNSNKWTPGLKKQLGVVNKDDGVFWMAFNDFVQYFNCVEFAHSPNYFNDVFEFSHSDSLPKIYRVQMNSLSTLSINVFDKENGSDFQCSIFLTKDDKVVEASLVHSKSHYSGRIYNLQGGEYHIVVYPKRDLNFNVKFSNNGDYKVYPNYRYDKNNNYLSKLVRSGSLPQNYCNLIKGTEFEKLISSLSCNSSNNIKLECHEFEDTSPEFNKIGKINCMNNMICLDDQNVNIKNDSKLKQDEKKIIVQEEKEQQADFKKEETQLYGSYMLGEDEAMTFEQNILYQKRQNFSSKYLIVKFPQNRNVKNVSIQVEMRDQGWTSSDCSGSYVEARIENIHGKEIFTERLFENLAVPNWKMYSLDINNGHNLFKYMNHYHVLNIYTISVWAGWEIWVKSAKCVVS